jgi:BlaI family penicillinase repressor
MKTVPRISETEWEVMKVVWGKSPISANEIVDILSEDDTWHPKTTKTLINRLVKKGALEYDKQGRAYIYRPAVKEADCVKAVSQSFLDRVFSGGLKPLLAHFVGQKRLSPDDAKELKRLLEERSRKK